MAGNAYTIQHGADCDRYLLRSTYRGDIFSAEARHRRDRLLLAIVAAVIAVLLIVLLVVTLV